MATRMQQRRGTAATWTAADPILAAGEIGFETDTNKFKIGDGSNRWVNLAYFVDGNSIIDGAPGLLNTLNELAAAVNDDPSFFATVATNLSNHEADTTNVHGIANTANLVTLTGTQTLTNKTLTSPVINTPTGITKSDVGLSNVDNTSDVNKPVSTAVQSALDLKAPIESPTFTGTVLGITKSMVGLSNVDNTSDINKPISTATQTILDQKAPLESPTFTGTVSGITKSMVGLGDVDNTSDANKPVSTATETALNLKAPIESPTFTGTVSGITKSMVGLSNVDNTSDVNKPISTATQTELDAKASLSGAVFSGVIFTTNSTESSSSSTGSVVTSGGLGVGKNAYIGGDLVIAGDFTVNGTTTTVSTQDLVVSDPIIYVGESNSANTVDLGIVASFDDGTYQHTGLIRDASAGTWKLFKGITDEPTTTVNFTQGSLDDLAVGGLSASSLHVGDVSNTELQYLNGVTSNIQTQLNSKSPSDSPTFTGTVSGITKSMVGLSNVDNTSDANKPVSTATQTALDLKANLASPTFTGTVSGITKSMVGLSNVDNTSDANKPISTATQTALDAKASTTDLSNHEADTTNIHGIANTAVLVTLAGTQTLTNKTLTSPSITTPSGIVKGDVGLGNVDNTSDANKPVSTAVQTALDLKAPLASPELTGTPTAPTAALGTNSTQVATTAFVDAAIEALASRSLILDGGGV